MSDNLQLIRSESMTYLKFVLRGRFAAYFIGLAATPIVMRFFNPSLYGQVTIAIMTGTLIGQVSTLAFEKASLVEQNEGKAELIRQLAALFSISVFFLGSIILAAFYLYGNIAQILSGQIHFVLVAMLCEALACIVIAERIAGQRLSRVANGELIQTIITSSGRIFAGLTGFISIATLFLWYCLGVITKILYLHLDKTRSSGRRTLFRQKRRTILRLIAENSDFPKYNVPTALMNQLTTYLPLFIFGIVFGPVVAGFYAISRRFVKAPGNLFVNMVTPILIRRFSTVANHSDDLRKLVKRTALAFGICGIAAAVGVLLFTNLVLLKVMTVEWSNAATMLNVLTPIVVVPFISAPVSAAMTAMRLQKPYFSNQTFVSIFRISALIIGISIGLSWEWAAGLFAWVSVLLTIISSCFLYRRHLFDTERSRRR